MPSQLSYLLLAFQNTGTQTVSTDSNQNLNFWLVIAGIAIIFFCMLMVFVPRMKDFITKPQEFNLNPIGVSMKVSILTVFVLMGFVLSLSSFVLQWRGYVTQVSESEKTIAGLKAQLDDKLTEASRSRRFDMSILIRPQTGSNETLNSDSWSCKYRFETPSGEPDKEVDATVARGADGRSLRIFLKDVSADTRVYQITLFKKDVSQTFTVANFAPLRDAVFEASREQTP
jgi:hypothetical protein